MKLGHIIYLNNKRYGANLVYIIARYVYTIHLLMCIYFFYIKSAAWFRVRRRRCACITLYTGAAAALISLALRPRPRLPLPLPPKYRTQGWLDEATSRRPLRDYNNQYLILYTLNACGGSLYIVDVYTL